MASPARVYLETGKVWTFAVAVDWPGWCRRGKGDEDALDALMDHAPRYVDVAGPGFAPVELEVIARVDGNATTDFGAPAAIGDWDAGPLDAAEAERLSGLLTRTWDVFDRVAGAAPAELRRGPRGGGRDRDAVMDHVREAERSYLRKCGLRVPPRTAWPAQREAFLHHLLTGAPGGSWPPRYAVRRVAWHVLDHAWEIEDRAGPEPATR